jgi:hypothetical protein
MVAAVTGHTTTYIEWEMPVPKGKQYQAIWLEMQGNITLPLTSESIDTAKWRAIAGR